MKAAVLDGLTIAIKCHRDRRIFSCLAALEDISGEVQKLVLISEGEPLECELKSLRSGSVGVVTVTRNDIGMRCNAAVAQARFDKILFIDDDCIATDTTAEAVKRALESAQVVRTRLVFERGHTVWSRAIAAWREHENNCQPVPAFMPGLGIHRSLLAGCGSPLFEEGLLFSVDDAFNTRLKRCGVPVTYLSDATVVHHSLTVQHFLRAGCRTGAGTARQVHFGLREHYERVSWIVVSVICLRWFPVLRRWRYSVGTTATIVAAAWYLAYLTGYYGERAKLRLSTRSGAVPARQEPG